MTSSQLASPLATGLFGEEEAEGTRATRRQATFEEGPTTIADSSTPPKKLEPPSLSRATAAVDTMAPLEQLPPDLEAKGD
jgi:hypothetical protein